MSNSTITKVRYFLVMTICAIALSLAACTPESPVDKPGANDTIPDKGKDTTKNFSELRTVILYIHADHDMYKYLYDNLNDIEQGWVENDSTLGRLMVYFYPPEDAQEFGSVPRLLRITKGDGTPIITSTVMKEYPRHDAMDPDVMRGVIEDAMRLAPSKHYALGFASHGYGWVPEDRREHPNVASLTNLPQTLGFGRKMEGWDLVNKALPKDVKFDFIFFNACLMSSVELMYEFKDKCDYLMASSAEMLGPGYPYRTNVKKLFYGKDSLVKFANNYYEYYEGKDLAYKSATIAIMDCSKFGALAQATKAVSAQSYDSIPGFQTIQYFNTAGGEKVFFDFGDYIHKTWGNKDALLMGAFDKALSEAVIFKANTQAYMFFPIKQHSGMTSFVPKNQPRYYTEIFCDKYTWSKDSGLGEVALKEKK